MKTLLTIVLLIIGIFHVNGQINPMDHLFKDKPRDLKVYINPEFQYSPIALQHATIAGLGAGVIIRKNFTVGAVYHFTLQKTALPEAIGPGKLQMKWGGIHLEYTLWPLQKVHLTFPLSAGIGQLKIKGSAAAPTGSPDFFFTEPGMIIEMNISKFAKLGIGTTYRYTLNVSYNSITSNDLNGFAAVASVKFGIFRYLKRDLDKLPH